uniref:Uncharacterized protein n=1 Tax=Arundo donax TaxID=35708 RepID=A0A0A8ZKF0_ARUDO
MLIANAAHLFGELPLLFSLAAMYNQFVRHFCSPWCSPAAQMNPPGCSTATPAILRPHNLMGCSPDLAS